MLGSFKLELSLQIGLVAVPVALYFLVLGLLNSQRRPQILHGRLDFALLAAAIAPMAAVPVLNWIGVNLITIAAAIAVVVLAVLALGPAKRKCWVIYNIDKAGAIRCLDRALRLANIPFEARGDRFDLGDGATIDVSGFPLLRNVTIRINSKTDLPATTIASLESELARRLAHLEVAVSPMAVSFVLVSTAMIVAPLILLSQRVPELVRLLSGS